MKDIYQSLKRLSTKAIIIALTSYAVLTTLGWLYYVEEASEKSAELLLKNKAVEAVDSYVEKTADTGEMDDFVQSSEGQNFYFLIGKVNNN